MKESIRDRILLYVYEQQGDKHEYVALQDFLKSLNRTDWDIGEDLRNISMFRSNLLDVQPNSEMQFLGRKNKNITIHNTPFKARLTAKGVAEVKRILAEDTSLRLTKSQLEEFPKTVDRSKKALRISEYSAAFTGLGVLLSGIALYISLSRGCSTQTGSTIESTSTQATQGSQPVTDGNATPDTAQEKKR